MVKFLYTEAFHNKWPCSLSPHCSFPAACRDFVSQDLVTKAGVEAWKQGYPHGMIMYCVMLHQIHAMLEAHSVTLCTESPHCARPQANLTYFRFNVAEGDIDNVLL